MQALQTPPPQLAPAAARNAVEKTTARSGLARTKHCVTCVIMRVFTTSIGCVMNAATVAALVPSSKLSPAVSAADDDAALGAACWRRSSSAA